MIKNSEIEEIIKKSEVFSDKRMPLNAHAYALDAIEMLLERINDLEEDVRILNRKQNKNERVDD